MRVSVVEGLDAVDAFRSSSPRVNRPIPVDGDVRNILGNGDDDCQGCPIID